jgi:hypothetical protein
MKKEIITASGNKKMVEIEGEFWGFKVGDVITADNLSTIWDNEEVIVEGFGEIFKEKGIWGRLKGNQNCNIHNQGPSGLILLERPSLGYKVGDKVEYKGCFGKIIVIRPSIGSALVDFDSDDFPGHNADSSWEEGWYPKNQKQPNRSSCFWFPPSYIPTIKVAVKKTIKVKELSNNNKLPKTLKTEGSLWGFKPGDLVYFYKKGFLYKQTAVIKGFTTNKRIWAIIPKTGRVVYFNNPSETILLSRRSLNLKVNNWVESQAGPTKGKKGIIQVIDPYKEICFVAFENFSHNNKIAIEVFWVPPDISQNIWRCSSNILKIC